MPAYDIKGRTCLITGAASGIGAACVEVYLKAGAKYVAILDIAENKGMALAEKLSMMYSGKVEFMKCDVSDEESATSAFNAVIGKVTQLDVIINNAGVVNDTQNMWRTSSDVNWHGVVSFTLKGVKHMRTDQGGAGGTIINVSSAAAFFMSPMLSTYYGSKAAVLHFSRCLALDPFHEKTGIRVMTICHSTTDTPMMCELSENVIDSIYLETMEKTLKTFKKQSPESAAAACLQMYENGANSSVWLSQNDAPAQDVTATIAEAYELMQSLIIH